MEKGYKSLMLILVAIFAVNSISWAQSQFTGETSDEEQKRRGLLMGDYFKKTSMSSFAAFKAITDNGIASWIEQYYDGETWVDDMRAVYEYEESRTLITIDYEYYDGGAWVAASTETIHLNEYGYPFELTYSWDGGEASQVVHFADPEAVRIDSITYSEIYEAQEDYFSRLEFDYVTDDSIQFVEYEREGNAAEMMIGTGYFVNRGTDFVEAYDYESEGYLDRYLYKDLSFSGFLKNFTNEFFFVEVYNDEYWYDDEEWYPYSRTTLTMSDEIVTEELVELFDSEWLLSGKRTINYDGNQISDILEEEYYGDDWNPAYKTNYTYDSSVSNEEGTDQVKGFMLSQNYPNPFNPSTKINYIIPNSGEVTLEVFNILGHKVATLVNEKKVAGVYSATFNANDIPSGIYYYKLQFSGIQEIRSMMLIK